MLRSIVYLIFLIIYHLFFWREGWGVNYVLFTALGILFAREKGKIESGEWIYLLTYLSSVIGFMFFRTVFSSFGIFISSAVYLGYIANRQTSVFENAFQGILSFFTWSNWAPARVKLKENPKKMPFLRGLTIGILPFIAFVVFYILFVNGNPIFKDLHEHTVARFSYLFEGINGKWIAFMILGVLIVRWAVLKRRIVVLSLNQDNFIQRKKRRFEGKALDLKMEYQMATTLFFLLNILFAVANFIDIKWVWFQFYVADQFSLKEFVHHGVGYLIFITLISGVILLYFFRGNLNYYSKRKRLVQLATLWTFQNIILTISVAIRTFHYIGFHGLAPLRIGVLIIAAQLLFVLVLVVVKINKRQSFSWVIRRSSAFSFVLLAVCVLIPWNRWIATHNLNHPISNEVDVDYYLQLQPDAYPILYDNMEIIENQLNAHAANSTRWVKSDMESFKAQLEQYTVEFLWEYENSSWMSWTPSAHRAYERLKEVSEAYQTNEAVEMLSE